MSEPSVRPVSRDRRRWPVAAALLACLGCAAVATPAFAAPPPRPPSSPPPPVPKTPYQQQVRTKGEVKNMKRNAVLAQRQRVGELQASMNSLAATARQVRERTGVDIANQASGRRALNRAINAHGQAVARLAQLRKQSLQSFAAQRNIRIGRPTSVTASPGSLGPPPGGPNGVPAGGNLAASKSWRPPGSNSPKVAKRTRF
ncbi:MAG: hypothetical protein R3E65_11885 [Steroidobacteraceae bacterium]